MDIILVLTNALWLGYVFQAHKKDTPIKLLEANEGELFPAKEI